jgi:peptidoglycan/LPS O-acetylase OafA/YrhL
VNTRAVNFPLMDSIRAIALISVVAAHTSFFVALEGTDALTKVRFDFGVRVFFIISAFLIYRPWVRARLRGYEPPRLKAYAWRRMLRVVPAYWVALTLITIWLGLVGVFTWTGVPIYYGFGQIYDQIKSLGGLPQAWSLCVEVVFYALIPVYAALLARLKTPDPARRLRQELIGPAVLFAIGVAYKFWIVEAGTLEQPELIVLQLNTLAFLDDFAIGMAAAAISVWYEGRDRDLPRPLRLVDRFPALPWLVALAAVWVVSTQLGLTGQLGEPVGRSQYVVRHYLYTIVAVGLVLPAMFGDPTRGWVRKLLANRALVYLGMVSYAVYLYHFAVLLQLERWSFADVASGRWAWVWFPAALAGGVFCATLSYYLVERPALGLKRLVKTRPEPQPGEAIEEPAPAVPPRPQQVG